ncbi:hypothetical protein BDV96DRAFT_347444 [Lophiotrema nucula]|uniref:Uncharacterized protein n=1 Tax=Lophiotrema nucula TaxID=690887 RepID=A0A6A5ZM28_9PLEO|nr:hypothetical protein BDV96DRAFT_347444 [Lophiotrema nucula]
MRRQTRAKYHNARETCSRSSTKAVGGLGTSPSRCRLQMVGYARVAAASALSTLHWSRAVAAPKLTAPLAVCLHSVTSSACAKHFSQHNRSHIALGFTIAVECVKFRFDYRPTAEQLRLSSRRVCYANCARRDRRWMSWEMSSSLSVNQPDVHCMLSLI